MMVKNFFILQLGVKMKKSKRYIKKQNNKPLINKKVLAKVIRESNICKHAIKELKLAGYGNGEGGPNDWMYQQVIEAVAVFASHGNNTNLLLLNAYYNIQWEECSCLRGIRLEDVTIEASYKYRTNTDKMTASDYTHLFGYLNPYYRSAYNVSKRRK
jgi:hypothetical protein